MSKQREDRCRRETKKGVQSTQRRDGDMFAEYDLPAGSHRIGANRYQEGDHSHCNHRNMELSSNEPQEEPGGPEDQEVGAQHVS